MTWDENERCRDCGSKTTVERTVREEGEPPSLVKKCPSCGFEETLVSEA